jgi:hypothetical protein
MMKKKWITCVTTALACAQTASLLLSLSAPTPALALQAEPQVHVNSDQATPPETPAQPDALLPTLLLSVSHGYAGQGVEASGEGVRGYPGVRLAWWFGEATRTAAEVSLAEDLTYHASLSVPSEAPPGEAQVCAAVTGTELAEFSCLPFLVETPPAASLSGSIPLSALKQPAAPQALAADLVLYASSGVEARRASIAQDGTFHLANLPPGRYSTGVEGSVPVLVAQKEILLAPGENFQASYQVLPNAYCAFAPDAAVTQVLVNPGVPLGLPAPGAMKTLGAYLALGSGGPPVNLVIKAVLQVSSGKTVKNVEFTLQRPDGSSTVLGVDTNGPPWQVSYNASLLQPGTSVLTATPHVQDGCTHDRQVGLRAVPYTLDNSVAKNQQISWNATAQRYEFQADLPNLPGLLPMRYPEPPPSVPLLGKIENKLDAGLHYEGYLYLNGSVSIHFAQNSALARIFSLDIYNNTKTMLSTEKQISGSVLGSSPPKAYFPKQYLLSIKKETTVFSGPIWSFAGIVTVKASIKVGINGDLTLDGSYEPLTPAADLVLVPAVAPYLPISIWLDLLLFIGRVGVTATTQLTFSLPLHINTQSASPAAWSNPCIDLYIWVTGWAEIDYYFDSASWDIFSKDIVKKSWGTCNAAMARSLQAQLTPLRVLAAPTLASGPGGQVGLLYVEDTTPTGASTTPGLFSRFWDFDANNWGNPIPVSDGAFLVKDPALTFIGASGQALAVWSQNTLTRQQGAALGQDVSAIFAHQELFYSLWDGSAWSAPAPITNDLVGDGVAALAGDASGGATLAWVRDTDGNLATHTDLEIAVAEWGSAGLKSAPQGAKPQATAGWTPMQLLPQAAGFPSPDTALDAQVSVVRPARRGLTSVLAWTRDADGEMSTNGDRSLAVAHLVNGSWSIETIPGLPSGADSPSLAWEEAQGTLHLAFLARGKDEDGLTDTGIGNTAALWTGHWTSARGWQQIMAFTQDGLPVRAERPLLQALPGSEVLLAFRRFDDAGTLGELGNLALSKFNPESSLFSNPMYLKNQPGTFWMHSISSAGMGSGALLAGLSRPAAALQPAAPSLPDRSYPSAVLSQASNGDVLETLALGGTADPALAPELNLSQPHAPSGTAVVITASLQNLGLSAASGMTVTLYEGQPGSGSPLTAQSVAGSLDFNSARQVTFTLRAAGGPQPVYAVVSTSGSDASFANNQAAGDLGALPAPGLPFVTWSGEHTDALSLSWQPTSAADVAGCRILRSQTQGGPYELVGQSSGLTYEDLSLKRGQPYYYVLQCYDSQGTWSPLGPEASGMLPLRQILIPQISRRAR